MKYLITGGAGFIGSTLSNFLLAQGQKVVVVDDLSMGSRENLAKDSNLVFIEGSVTDRGLLNDVLSKYQFDYIFHLAAIASVADSVERPIETHKVNYDSVLELLVLVKEKQLNLKRLVFSSSAAVYGDLPELPKKEDSSIRPMTQYAVDKYSAERTVLNFYSLYNVPTSAVRFFNVYGPKQNPYSPYSGVISILLNIFEDKKKGFESTFTLYGDGEQTRDFIYVDDVVEALLIVSESADSIGRVFNVGTSKEVSLNTVIDKLNDLYGMKLPIKKMPSRQGDINRSVSDNSKLVKLGLSRYNSIGEGLKEMLKELE